MVKTQSLKWKYRKNNCQVKLTLLLISLSIIHSLSHSFSQKVTSLSFFCFMTYLERFRSRIPDAWLVILTFSLLVTIVLQKLKRELGTKWCVFWKYIFVCTYESCIWPLLIVLKIFTKTADNYHLSKKVVKFEKKYCLC